MKNMGCVFAMIKIFLNSFFFSIIFSSMKIYLSESLTKKCRQCIVLTLTILVSLAFHPSPKDVFEDIFTQMRHFFKSGSEMGITAPD